MKKLLLIFATLLFAIGPFFAFSAAPPQSDLPAGTLVIKHPDAGSPAWFEGTVYHFWIYAASPERLSDIISSFEKNESVESCVKGASAGEHNELVIVLKNKHDKKWFIRQFKNAGIKYIKINNNPAVETGNI
jgi:hypothetical protein